MFLRLPYLLQIYKLSLSPYLGSHEMMLTETLSSSQEGRLSHSRLVLTGMDFLAWGLFLCKSLGLFKILLHSVTSEVLGGPVG